MSSNIVIQSASTEMKNATLANDDEAKKMETVHDDHEYIKVLAQNFHKDDKNHANILKPSTENCLLEEGQDKDKKEAFENVHDMETVHDEHEYIKVLSENFHQSNFQKGSAQNFQKSLNERLPSAEAEHKI